MAHVGSMTVFPGLQCETEALLGPLIVTHSPITGRDWLSLETPSSKQFDAENPYRTRKSQTDLSIAEGQAVQVTVLHTHSRGGGEEKCTSPLRALDSAVPREPFCLLPVYTSWQLLVYWQQKEQEGTEGYLQAPILKLKVHQPSYTGHSLFLYAATTKR